MILGVLLLAAQAQAAPGTPNQRPHADLGALFDAGDYPVDAARRGEEGAVGFRLAVGADGRVTDCTITRTSGSAALDETTCAIIRQRARYRPATDAEGRAIAGTDMGRVGWHLPPPPPPFPENCAGCTPPREHLGSLFSTNDYPRAALATHDEGRVAFRVLVGADGRVKRCEVTETSGSRALDLTTCAIVLARARYRPARDPAGNAVEGVNRGSATWRLPSS